MPSPETLLHWHRELVRRKWISTAIWAGVFQIIGAVYGGRAEAFLRDHRETCWLLALGLGLLVVGAYVVSHFRSFRGSKPVPTP